VIRSVEPKIVSVIQAVLDILCCDAADFIVLLLSSGFVMTSSIIHHCHTL
jgi:hypothetical protein